MLVYPVVPDQIGHFAQLLAQQVAGDQLHRKKQDQDTPHVKDLGAKVGSCPSSFNVRSHSYG